jgi:hypothetical protein
VSDTNADGKWGWGLAKVWDAFSDGSTNPDHTVYTVTTAYVGHAYWEAWLTTGNPTYLDDAERVCDDMISTIPIFNPTATRMWMAYSDQASDSAVPEYEVYNTSAATAALFLRVGKALRRADLLAYGVKMLDRILDAQAVAGSWEYSYNSGTPELSHAPVIIWSVLVGFQCTGLARFREAGDLGATYWIANAVGYQDALCLSVLEDITGVAHGADTQTLDMLSNEAAGLFYGSSSARQHSAYLWILAEVRQRARYRA